MRMRRLKKLWKRLHELQGQKLTRDQLLIKLGAAKKDAGRDWSLVKINLPEKDQAVSKETFIFELDKKRLCTACRREGHYLLRSNLIEEQPARLWECYIRLTEIEQAFKELKSYLSVRPIYHQKDNRIAYFYCLCGLLHSSYLEAAASSVGAGADSQGSHRKVCCNADGRYPFANDRWEAACSIPLYATG